ncbi:class I SAM-dependent methyltransferase [Haloarcula sp. CBA1115]|uniref:class I SAM-dependent methyltransferase n=1 Tax=Haloarcula sp. CBA1115 TaxID=1592728 RepID=UPI002100766B|nr:class I SAM-dependent methyltransferase [Haloarcula sp. CBA1115]
MSDATWDVQDGAIVERPRNVRKHPLLHRIYERHDELLAEQLPPGRTLELAFGQHMHPRADVGLEGWPSNVETVRKPALAGDARALPFADDSFDALIGRRFLHHVPPADRPEIIREAARVLRPAGRIALLEGTPGCTASSPRVPRSGWGCWRKTPTSTATSRRPPSPTSYPNRSKSPRNGRSDRR